MTEPRTPETPSTSDPYQPLPGAVQPPSASLDADTPGPGKPPYGSGGDSRRGKLLSAVIVIAAVVIGSLGWRFISQQAGSLLSSAFGGSDAWRRLPGDARDDFERRVKAAAGDLEGMSDAQANQQAQIRVASGMRRLDDAVLVRRLTIQTVALGKVDNATCGQFAQASFAGAVQPDNVALKLMEVMTEAELREWFNVAVLALEAEARQAPEPRNASEAETNAVFERLFASLDSATMAKIQTAADPAATPADACLGARSLYNAIEALPDADRRLIALADVSL